MILYNGYSGYEWDPEADVGGSEEAVIHLANQLADRGWNVTVYNRCGYKKEEVWQGHVQTVLVMELSRQTRCGHLLATSKNA